MRIAIWADICLSNSTGMGRSVRATLKALRQLDRVNEYTLFYSGQYACGLLTELGGRGEFRIVRLRETRRWLRQQWLGGLSPVDQEIGPHDVIFNPAVYWIPAMHGDSLGMIHDISVHKVPRAYSWKNRVLGQLSQAQVARRSKRILTISQATKRDIIEAYDVPSARVWVAPHGVGDEFSPASEGEVVAFRERHDLPGQYVMWVGEIQERKNLVRLVNALGIARSTVPGLALVLAGTEGYRSAEVHEAVRRNRLEGAVRFVGRLSDADLKAGLTGTVAFAFPSLYEGFGMPILEAFACGAPVMTANCSSLPEVAGEAALLVNPFSEREMSEALIRFCREEGLGLEMRARGIERARAFTWSQTAERWRDFFEGRSVAGA